MSTVHQLLSELQQGVLRPCYLVVGSEPLLVERALDAIRTAALSGEDSTGEELFHGSAKTPATAIVTAAQTLPMFATRRLVVVRGIDAYDASELGVFSDYFASPNLSTCFVATASKLNGQVKLIKVARDAKAKFDAEPLKGHALREFIVGEAQGRGHPITHEATETILDAIGDDLSSLDDVLERLSLYVGPGQRIDADATLANLTQAKPESIWALVDGIAQKDSGTAIKACVSLMEHREPPLRVLTMIARQIRMIAQMRHHLEQGLSNEDAAKAAGAPPFKARELRAAAARFRYNDIQRCVSILATLDLSLKGSRVPGELLLEQTVLELCRPSLSK